MSDYLSNGFYNTSLPSWAFNPNAQNSIMTNQLGTTQSDAWFPVDLSSSSSGSDWTWGTGTGIGTGTGTDSSSGIQLGWNTQTLGTAIQGLSALGNLWNAWQSNSLAKKQYNLAKEAYETNMSNSIKSYNTALTDRIRARAAMETGDSSAYDDYLEENKL